MIWSQYLGKIIVDDTKDNIVIPNCGTVANNDKNNEDEDRKPDISSND